MSRLSLRGLTKAYGKQTVVDHIDLTLTEGEFVSLLGPSGCGKTTTLRMIAGLEMASEGQILIGGRDVTNLSAADRDVSMVFQSYALFPHMSVLENVMLAPVRVLGEERAAVRDRALALLARIGLGDKAGAYPDQLSGGQQQRVAIVRALA
ncbi:MAG: ABC transporter ATP-binding protein, partial [Gammaproteobacteria bacterium]